MHEDLDTPGPAELEQLADNEAGEGRMPNCQHFRRLARKWREDREDRDVLRHALLQATTEKARARRAELKPSAERIAYAVALQGDHGITLAPLCKAPACAIQALSPFEGAAVVGLATIAVEAEAISGMQYRLRHAGAGPQHGALPHTVPVRDAIHGTVEVTKVFPGDVVAEERDLQASEVEPATGDLLPCPFCGKSNQDRFPCEWLDDSGANVIRCAWCHGAAPMSVWNRRTAPQQASAPVGVEALVERWRTKKRDLSALGCANELEHALAQQPAAEYADVDALIAHLDSLCDESDEKWDVAQDAIAGIRAGQQPAAADDDAEPAEPCESGLPDCGPAVAWDRDGIGACDRCAKELGWIADQQQGGAPE